MGVSKQMILYDKVGGEGVQTHPKKKKKYDIINEQSLRPKIFFFYNYGFKLSMK